MVYEGKRTHPIVRLIDRGKLPFPLQLDHPPSPLSGPTSLSWRSTPGSENAPLFLSGAYCLLSIPLGNRTSGRLLLSAPPQCIVGDSLALDVLSRVSN